MRDDIPGMDCQGCREAISAGLDGEATAAETAAAHVHLAGCAECRTAQERAERVTRVAREYPVDPGPGPAAILRGALELRAAEPSPGCGSNVVRLHPVGATACGCAASCACGCQAGRPCRCGHVA